MRAHRVSRWLVIRLLARIRGGEIEIVEGERRLLLGDSVAVGNGGPVRSCTSTPALLPRPAARSVGLCESYMAGLWTARTSSRSPGSPR